MTDLQMYTCFDCGRCDHDTPDCPAPTIREVAGWLCVHGGAPEVIRDGLQCSNDEVIYLNDRVTLVTHLRVFGGPVTKADVSRGCRANNADGRPCTLHAGHQWWQNHTPGYTAAGESIGPAWHVEPVSDVPSRDRITR